VCVSLLLLHCCLLLCSARKLLCTQRCQAVRSSSVPVRSSPRCACLLLLLLLCDLNSQVALKACHYACERHFFDEVLFCSLEVEPTSSDDSSKAMPGSAARARSSSLHGSNGNIAALIDTARARAVAKAVFGDASEALLGTAEQIKDNLINAIGQSQT
jgi:hypothetical protein